MLVGMSRAFLVVEDEAPLARALTRQLEEHRPVVWASSLAEAREALFRRDDWAGVLLDLILPDGHGLDLLEEIRERRPLLPVVVLTGELRPELVNRVQALDAAYVCKPANRENVERFVRSALGAEPLETDEVTRRIDRLMGDVGLTRREAQLLGYAVDGLSRRQLAETMGVAENTVKAQIRSILRKTKARSIATLAQSVLRG